METMRCVCVARGEQRGAGPWWTAACADTPPAFSLVCFRVRSQMFYDASSFNGDLSKWEVSGVKDMRCVCVARGEQRGAGCVCWSADMSATAFLRVLLRVLFSVLYRRLL